MVVDSDKRPAMRDLSSDAPLSAAAIDRSFSMSFPDHACNLAFRQFPLSSAHLGMLGPNKPLNPGCPVATRSLF
jgi:hypothetical protein